MGRGDQGVQELFLQDDGVFPNSALPVLIYSDLEVGDPEALIRRNGWDRVWTNGIYRFPHYHSTAHEALLVRSGSAEVQLGGPSGQVLHLKVGLGLVLPAGVAHQCHSHSDDFQVMGAYPEGQVFDTNYGRAGERAGADARIAQLALPERDPFLGDSGPLPRVWKSSP